MLKENCYITHLDLSNNAIGAAGAVMLYDVLHCNTTVVHCNLSGKYYYYSYLREREREGEREREREREREGEGEGPKFTIVLYMYNTGFVEALNFLPFF